MVEKPTVKKNDGTTPYLTFHNSTHEDLPSVRFPKAYRPQDLATLLFVDDCNIEYGICSPCPSKVLDIRGDVKSDEEEIKSDRK
jgi:hypothetical protein